MEGMFSDYFTQSVIERKTDLQWYRLKTFACFNSVIMSIDYAIINKFLPTIIHRTGLLAVAQKVLIYEVILAPLWYFPIFYYVQQALHDQNNFSLQSFKIGLQHYRQNYKNDISAMWSVWVPACFMIFGLAPKHLVLPFMVCVDVSWLVGLSLYRGDIHKIYPGADNI